MIGELMQIIESVRETPEQEAARAAARTAEIARQQRGLSDADLASLSATAFQRRQSARAYQQPSSAAINATQDYTDDLIMDSPTTPARNLSVGTSLAIRG